MIDKVLFRSLYAFLSISVNFIIWRVLGFIEGSLIVTVITGKSFGRVESNFYRIVDLLIAAALLLIVILINYLFHRVMRRIGEMSKRWLLIPLLITILTVVISFITF